jgi:hypothetical protein
MLRAKSIFFLWIHVEKGTCQHISVNGAPHQSKMTTRRRQSFGHQTVTLHYLHAVAL